MTQDLEQRRNDTTSGKKRGRSVKRIAAVLLFLLFLLLIWFLWFRKQQVAPAQGGGVIIDTVSVDTTVVADTLQTVADTVDSVVQVDTISDNIETVMVAPTPVPEVKETIRKDTVVAADTVDLRTDSTVADTIAREPDLCSQDTAALWVYPDPSGGLHYRQVAVAFVANRKAKIHYKRENDSGWQVYKGTPVTISTTTTLFFDAIDSCGRVMERRTEYYEIDTSRNASPCTGGMEYVKVGSMRFCIDRYEWPNRKGKRPQSFVSYYQAMDSCFSVDKRMCTAEEWAVACGGPYSYTYPYGNSYEPYGCVTHDTLVAPSGSKPECRSFFGVFDMSGNLLEWTSTKARENSAFYYVAGGFWESGPKCGCGSRRYSYYPQNQHNPVGFRCCRNVADSNGAKGSR